VVLCLWLHLHRWAIEPWPLNLASYARRPAPGRRPEAERQVADRDTAGDTDGAGHPLVLTIQGSPMATRP